MVVCRVLVGRWQSRAGSAIGVDGDGVARDGFAVGASDRLLRADGAGRLDVDAVVLGDIGWRAFDRLPL